MKLVFRLRNHLIVEIWFNEIMGRLLVNYLLEFTAVQNKLKTGFWMGLSGIEFPL